MSTANNCGLNRQFNMFVFFIYKNRKKKKKGRSRIGKEKMATTSENGRGGIGGGDRTAKAIVADQISQAVNSTANLLHLMRQSSSSQVMIVRFLNRNLVE